MTPADNFPMATGIVTAPDGTHLATLTLGSGRPLVVCHGAFTMARDWLPFAAQMVQDHTVILYDRRARGDSQSAVEDFAIDAEVDDLAAIMDHAGPDAALLGHSFGGACALAYAARGGFAGSLIVYEPPHSARGPVSRGHIPEIERLIASGDTDAATAYAIGHVVGMPPQAIAAFRQSPLWVPMCETVRAFPKELRFLDSLTWQAGDLDGIRGRPCLLVGANSPALPDAISPVAALQALLPAMRTHSLAGQDHVAYLENPVLLAETVRACLAGDDG